MKKKIFSILLFATALASSGCNDWLDMTPTDKVSDKIVWSDKVYVEQYVNGFYPYISIYGNFGGGDTQVGITEGLTETIKYGSMTQGTHVGFANIVAFAEGGIAASTAAFHFGSWDDTYNRIRRVNEFIYGLRKFSTFDEATSNRFLAEARFFRGYLYFQLLKRTPEAILYRENLLDIVENKALSTEEEGWNLVQEDLDFAAKQLPPSWDAANVGRVTKGAAYAMQSRAMLYAKRWQVAKDAAEEVFKLGYVLMPGTTATDYAKAFTSVRAGNTEAILEYNYLTGGPNHNWDDMFMPGGDFVTKGGRGVPTQEMVECYETADSKIVDWSKWHVAGGTDEIPPYASLEPRFHASILYNGCDWKSRQIESYVGGTDGWMDFNDGSDPAGRSTTSYYLRKMVDEKHVDYTKKSTQTWVGIRLAEVHLNHAEACYMLGVAGANADIRAIRARVGLTYNDLSGTDLMNTIRKERKIELFCEGHLYWDMRRWKLAHTAYSGANSRVHGFKIEKAGAVLHFTYVDCDKQDRLFEHKLYRIPLPTTELSNNSAVKQFPEWL